MQNNTNNTNNFADLIITSGRIHTLNPKAPIANAIAIKGGIIVAIGDAKEVMEYKGEKTQVIEVQGRTVIPGLNDSHLHLIRGGLNYNMELRWDGVPSLAEALRRLKEQAERTPPPEWVRVIGGWTEFQFAEKRMPTLDEINAASKDTPVFVLHLYDRALLNQAAVRTLGYTKDTPNPPGGEIQRDHNGNPTGMLIAKPNAMILYSSLAKGPKLSYEDQVNSTRQFMRELNRLGITSVIDAGGGFQNYPDDYAVVEELSRRGLLTIRIAYNLFTQHPKQELDDFSKWVSELKPYEGTSFYRLNGAGEMLVFSAADFEDFIEPRPELNATMEAELKQIVRLLVENKWPFRLHSTYDESITRFLNVIEEVNKEIPVNGLRWFFDHAETICQKNIDRVSALGGGIAIQDRMAFQGEYFASMYGKKAAADAPPIAKMLKAGIPVGAGTDATRVASYNPWVSLYWLVSGRTVGGAQLYDDGNQLDCVEALWLYTAGSAWFSGEEKLKGTLEVGKFGDLAVLSDDFFTIDVEAIKHIESVLTVVNGKVVYGMNEFASLAPPPLPVSPDWSPVAKYGGYPHPLAHTPHYPKEHQHLNEQHHCNTNSLHKHWIFGNDNKLWSFGCDCWV